MIQDIAPSRLNNSYTECTPGEGDGIFVFDSEGRALLESRDLQLAFPDKNDVDYDKTVYLFSVDERKFFLYTGDEKDITIRRENVKYYTIREIRDIFADVSQKDVFALFTAYHLWKWYLDNRYCGRCGGRTVIGKKERCLVCKECKNVIYPRINPAVIVGVTKGDSLLITRYKTGYAHNALVAGFTEIGETLEETVKREVMEETGIRVKNIRYYKSQPWGMAQDILAGFFCEADGDSDIKMDESELKYASWVNRKDIELQPNNLSLTNEMMRVFRDGM